MTFADAQMMHPEDIPVEQFSEAGKSEAPQEPKYDTVMDKLAYHKKGVVVLISALILIICLSVDLDEERPLASRGLAVLLIVALWWLTEVLPLTVSSLFPIVLYPLLAVATPSALASKFFGGTSFLFVGGFIIGLAIERWGLHIRIICAVVCNTGKRPDVLLAGFMGAVFLLSMWISNTATAVCMMPVVHTFLKQLPDDAHKFKQAVLLSVGWSASIGGIATPVGTPTNGIFLDQYLVLWPNAGEFPFATFVFAALPLALILLFILWFSISAYFVWFSKTKIVINTETFHQMRRDLGPMTYEEIIVSLDLVVLVALWFTASPIGSFPGWKVHVAENLNSGSIGLLVTLPLFIVPCGAQLPKVLKNLLGDNRCLSKVEEKKPPAHILDWDAVKGGFSWEILFVFGGGAMLAYGTVASGLAGWIAEQLSQVGGGEFGFVLIVSCVVCLVTEVVSNTSTMSIFGAIIAATASLKGFNGVQMMMGVCFTASFCFMLPTATPPNMVVYATGLIKVREMAKMGALLDLIAILVGTCYFVFIMPAILGDDFETENIGEPAISA
eukprot:CAMPEP_0206440616 /NCGR_PEP_ID=MMETSP0324_2-20121206/12845_1 /ASSEMBLY_ACC=CAM_ASM_000836 /TAXON_ID=2866 /ORGANISM="Crypthecodinium cohnii, Strain Seligo" /LENGTH=555 /DNA_ID=CAMNT_0053908327 /DNA_START=81 /DNA_END=1748 /DNA_ORIENTATION=-